MHDHHVHGGRDSRWMTMGNHRQAVADHGDVDASHFRPFG
jgi:hypothetical protein